jgi:hypothetical protein
MKTILSISLLLVSQILTAQIIASKTDVEEYNFFYSDTANGEFAFGDYEPKDLIRLNDSSYLVGTELSISFPSQYKTTGNYDSTYFAKSKIFREKSHTSSGTVFKLNSNFEKEWETIFKEQRIEKILKTSDDRILIVGEDVSMKFVWLAELDKNGNVKWKKHFDYKNQVTIADARIDNNNEIYLLLESSHIIPVQIRKYYGKKRIHLFKDSEINSHLAILKVSSEGKKKWLKPIDKRRKHDKFGYNLVASKESLFASYTYSGFEKDSLIEGKKVIEISKSGKAVVTQEITKQDILLFKNGLVTISSDSKGELKLYKTGELIDSINLEGAGRDMRIEKVINKFSGFLILGSKYNNRNYLLVNLSSELKFGSYSTYAREEYSKIRGAVTLDNGEIIIVGKCYRREKEGVDKRLTTYINLIKIKNGA